MSRKPQLSLPFVHGRDDLILAARVSDLIGQAAGRNTVQATKFLSDRQRIVAEYVLAASGNPRHGFYGGYPGAERTVLAVGPEYPGGIDIDEGDYGITPILVKGSGFRNLSHRDYLGTLMSLGLERETTGDILCVSGSSALIFVCSSVSGFITSGLESVSGDGVSCSVPDTSSEEYRGMLAGLEKRYERSSETVPSMRLDAVCSAALGVSRTKAEALIESGGVEVNHFAALRKDTEVVHGDRLSVKGYGKYRIESSGGVSKKGRLWIDILKYV